MTNINIELIKCSNTILRPNNIQFTDEFALREIYLFFFNQLRKKLNPKIDIIVWENSLEEMRKYANVILNNLFNDSILIIQDNIKKEDAFNQIISKIERNIQHILCEGIQYCNFNMDTSFKKIILDKNFPQLEDNNILTLKKLQNLNIENVLNTLINQITWMK